VFILIISEGIDGFDGRLEWVFFTVLSCLGFPVVWKR